MSYSCRTSSAFRASRSRAGASGLGLFCGPAAVSLLDLVDGDATLGTFAGVLSAVSGRGVLFSCPGTALLAADGAAA